MRRIISLLILAFTLFVCVPTLPLGPTFHASLQQAGDPNVTVWVNTKSGVYHCPGTRWYGKTQEGKYMKQREAQASDYRPAYGNVCG
jgi:hypothetical protein